MRRTGRVARKWASSPARKSPWPPPAKRAASHAAQAFFKKFSEEYAKERKKAKWCRSAPPVWIRGAGSKISFTNSSRYQRENYMAENGQLTGTFRVKSGMAQMLKGGVIMDVVDAEQARIAEEAGAVAVMALERVPADIRADGGVARMSDPEKIVEIQESVTIPVMAKARIGHFVEAQILEALEVDYIDESEVLTPRRREAPHRQGRLRRAFRVRRYEPGEALRRIGEGAAMIRSKGEAGTGNVVEAVRHMRAIVGGIRSLGPSITEEMMTEAKNLGAPYELVRWVAENGRLPVVLFTAGGIATPADAALMMQLGADGVFVGSGIFKSGDPALRARAIVKATTHFKDAKAVAEASRGLGVAMVGREMGELSEGERLATRGW